MAMYEKRVFCPNNGFFQEEMRGNTSYFWERTKELLGDRIDYMVYDSEPKGDSHGYLVDTLTHAVGTLGIEVAAALRAMIPVCSYAEIGRPIVLKDVDGLPQPWELQGITFEDKRYMVNLTDNGEEIFVCIYKK